MRRTLRPFAPVTVTLVVGIALTFVTLHGTRHLSFAFGDECVECPPQDFHKTKVCKFCAIGLKEKGCRGEGQREHYIICRDLGPGCIPPFCTAAVKNIQKSLEAAGHSPGAVDGVWGRKTRRALTEFQKANGLAATGTVNDAETLKRLGFTSADQLGVK